MGRFYEFRPEDATGLARQLGEQTKRNGDELSFKLCPFCKGGHNGKDKYTFAINLKTGQCNCRRSSCGYNGNMITLSQDLGYSLGRDVDAYYKLSSYTEKIYTDFSAYRDKHAIPNDPAIEYLSRRGISKETATRYELAASKDDPEKLAFLFRDPAGEIQMVKYRNMAFIKGVTAGNKEWCIRNCKPILFGMYQCKSRERLVITEGQMDSLSLAEAGIENAVSVPTGANGFTWVPFCWDFMQEFQELVVFGDYEKGTITLSEEIAARWPDKTKIVRAEDYKGCKDANEILQKYGKQALVDAVNNAQGAGDRRIKPMTEVRSVDIMKMTTLSTGIQGLDDILSGGFREGQLIVLTGRRGEGKSTLGSMIGVNALRNNMNCFFYSGELMDFYFRNWMDRQILGKDVALTDSQSDEDEERKFLNQNFYADKAYIYDNTVIDLDEIEDIPKTIEVAIQQKACKFILVDNLMTAIDPEAQDLYRAQSKFVGELASLAKKYSVIIMLVAHPRKSNQSLSNDDISGSADITNKADIVLTYGRREKSEDPDLRELSVIKNRLTGKLTKDPINLIFDGPSKRIAESRADFRKMTEEISEGFRQLTVEEAVDLPFESEAEE